MPTLKRSHILIPALMLLSACGGGSGGCAPSDGRSLDATTDTSENCTVTRAASSVTLSYPNDDAIVQLESSPGIYSRIVHAVVTDQNGNGVADDTIVHLDVFDSLIARGIIAVGDTISGTTLTDNAGIFQGNGTTATTFNTAVVTRNLDTNIGIEAGDIVILVNAAESDRIRYVASITANSITVDQPYNNIYPSPAYTAAQYLVGKTLLSTKVHGFDDTGAEQRGLGRTVNGIADFRLEYSANILGYGRSATDARFIPLGSASVWVVANVGGNAATATPTSFPGIAPAEIVVFPSAVAAGGDVTVTVEDAHFNRIPFALITASSDTPANSTGTSCTTDEVGQCTSTITYGGAAKITYTLGGGSGELDVQ